MSRSSQKSACSLTKAQRLKQGATLKNLSVLACLFFVPPPGFFLPLFFSPPFRLLVTNTTPIPPDLRERYERHAPVTKRQHASIRNHPIQRPMSHPTATKSSSPAHARRMHHSPPTRRQTRPHLGRSLLSSMRQTRGQRRPLLRTSSQQE